MPAYSCPKGHQSSEEDFCSECGAKIQGAPSTAFAPPPVTVTGSSAPCPDCAAPRADTSSNFCEVCGYNFATGTHGNIPVEAVPAPVIVPPTTPPVVIAPQAPQVIPPKDMPPPPPDPEPEPVKHWTLVAVVDSTLREPDSPEPPANVAPINVKLDKPVNLIGRRSEKRAIIPEVSLDLDDAVSHRHALLTCGDDGSLTLRDIGSANGTRLNGSDVQPLVDIALHDGDQITLGRWTRLTVRTI
jgi:FHA domain